MTHLLNRSITIVTHPLPALAMIAPRTDKEGFMEPLAREDNVIADSFKNKVECGRKECLLPRTVTEGIREKMASRDSAFDKKKVVDQ